MKVILEIEYNASEWTILWLFKALIKIGIKPKIFKFETNTKAEVNKSFYSISFIKKVTCMVTDTPPELFESSSRKQEVAENRQIAMYFCRKYTRKSLREIGLEFGNKTPATIMHACKVIQDLIYSDKNFQLKLERIEKKINSGGE